MNLQALKVFNGTPWYYPLLPVPLESMNWLYMLVVEGVLFAYEHFLQYWTWVKGDFGRFPIIYFHVCLRFYYQIEHLWT